MRAARGPCIGRGGLGQSGRSGRGGGEEWKLGDSGTQICHWQFVEEHGWDVRVQ